MSQAAVLSRQGGELLLRLLEQAKPVVASVALEELRPEVPAELLKNGALKRSGFRRTALVVDGDVPTFRHLAWEADQKAYGYFTASDRSVVVSADSQALYSVALPWWLAWLAHVLALANSGQPTELVPGFAWDIGDLSMTRQRKAPIVFGRRLHRRTTHQALCDELSRRVGRNGGIILTSSATPLAREIHHPPFVVLPIIELLTNDLQLFAIDRDLLLSPYTGRRSNTAVIKPLELSPDGRLLMIHGVTVAFRSDIHIKLVRQLVHDYRQGKRRRAQELLDEAKSGVTSLARAFGTKKWNQLKRHLNSKDGLWGFEV